MGGKSRCSLRQVSSLKHLRKIFRREEGSALSPFFLELLLPELSPHAGPLVESQQRCTRPHTAVQRPARLRSCALPTIPSGPSHCCAHAARFKP